jgi:hypothetical protein
METRSSFSIINRDQYFVFMTATEENLDSKTFVITKGSDTFVALSDKLG